MTISEMMSVGKKRLQEAGIETPDSDVRVLIESITEKKAASLFLYADEEVEPEQEKTFFEAIEKRVRHVPVQYITGEQDFCGLHFRVNPSVLIPRPETELLAEMTFQESQGKRVLDLCTGSGCIAITIAKLGKPAYVCASDFSKEALDTAAENAEQNEVTVDFVLSDLFREINQKFDLIVSNPPYINTSVVETLLPEVKDMEPRIALDGGIDGLDFYRRISREAAAHLNDNGRLMLEIGYDQGEQVSKLLLADGYFNVEVKKDYTGLDRFVLAGR